jgi:hypothetical protein
MSVYEFSEIKIRRGWLYEDTESFMGESIFDPTYLKIFIKDRLVI